MKTSFTTGPKAKFTASESEIASKRFKYIVLLSLHIKPMRISFKMGKVKSISPSVNAVQTGEASEV